MKKEMSLIIVNAFHDNAIKWHTMRNHNFFSSALKVHNYHLVDLPESHKSFRDLKRMINKKNVILLWMSHFRYFQWRTSNRPNKQETLLKSPEKWFNSRKTERKMYWKCSQVIALACFFLLKASVREFDTHIYITHHITSKVTTA